MKVRALSFTDDPDNAPALYACGVCGKCYSPKIAGAQSAIDAAERCCNPKQHVCKVCGVEVPRYWTLCDRHAEHARLRKAVQIDAAEYCDPVFLDGASGGWGDGFFEGTDDLRDAWTDNSPQSDLPAFCWTCKVKHLRLDPDSLLEMAADDMHEDAFDEIEDSDGLRAFIEAWNAKQTCVSWRPDYSRVVVLDRARFEELLNDE